jgi:nucleoside-diphosphate-sugar epimerase
LATGGDQRAGHTYIRDFVDGALRALDHPEHGYDVYNIASGACHSLAQVAQVVHDLVPGAQIEVGPGPIEWLPGKPMPVKGALDVTRARRELGYEPKYDLKTGLAEYIAWFRRGQPPGG